MIPKQVARPIQPAFNARGKMYSTHAPATPHELMAPSWPDCPSTRAASSSTLSVLPLCACCAAISCSSRALGLPRSITACSSRTPSRSAKDTSTWPSTRARAAAQKPIASSRPGRSCCCRYWMVVQEASANQVAAMSLPTRMKMGRDHDSHPGTKVITTDAASSMKMMPHTEKAYAAGVIGLSKRLLFGVLNWRGHPTWIAIRTT
mmetsp:Transcript_13018/g.35453  ORF Transcript_13018/g.35453 Transcript_13018/m.35453 type:complete len:205 (-) Transcript_13018:125-739(-)